MQGARAQRDKHLQKAESVRVGPASPPPPRPPKALQPALGVFRSGRLGPHGHCRGAHSLGLHRQELREKYSWRICCLGQNLGGTRLPLITHSLISDTKPRSSNSFIIATVKLVEQCCRSGRKIFAMVCPSTYGQRSH